MLTGELHAIFLGMHPLGSIAPDQSGCNAHRWGARLDQQQATARIHVRGSTAPATRSDTTRHATGQKPVTMLLTEAP